MALPKLSYMVRCNGGSKNAKIVDKSSHKEHKMFEISKTYVMKMPNIWSTDTPEWIFALSWKGKCLSNVSITMKRTILRCWEAEATEHTVAINRWILSLHLETMVG